MTAESSTALIAQRWANGQHLYTDFRRPPFLITPFPPGLYAILALADRAGVSTVTSLTFLGRLLSLVCLLGVGCVAYFWNRASAFSREAALVTPLLFLSFPALLPWAATLRQDFPALCLGILAIVVAHARPAARYVFAAALLAALAFLVKHSSIAVPTSLVLWLWLNRRWKHALAFSASWFGIVGLVFAAFQASSPGLMRLNIAGAKIFGTPSLQNVHDSFVTVAWSRGSQVVILMLTLAIVGIAVSWTKISSRDFFLVCYFVISMGLALFVSRFSNATVNHYIEPALVWALLAPVALRELESHWPQGSPLAFFLVVAMVMLVLPSIDVQRWNMMNDTPDNLDNLARLVRDKTILTDVPYLAVASAQPQFVETISLRFSEKAGVWSGQPLETMLQARNFDLVALHWSLQDARWENFRYSRLGPGIRRAIDQNYSFCASAEGIFFYTPSTPPGPGLDQRDCLQLQSELSRVH